MPFDHQAHIPDGMSSQHTLKMLKRLNDGPCKSNCAVGSGGQQVGYLAHGTATDYVFLKGGAKIAMTWEIYGDETASYMDCFKAFNPTTEQGYEILLQTWSNAIFEMLLAVRDHPDFAHVFDDTRAVSGIGQQPAELNSPGPPRIAFQVAGLLGFLVAIGSLGYIVSRSYKSVRSKRLRTSQV